MPPPSCTVIRSTAISPQRECARSDEEMPPCHHVLRGNAKHSALYAESRYFRGKRREFDALVAGLLDVFQSPLVTGDYSYRNGAYCSFSAQDLKIIATVVKQPGT
jgi:hypothetical protein